jgi:hypothetical protein
VVIIFYIKNEKKESKTREKELKIRRKKYEKSKPIIKSRYVAAIQKNHREGGKVITDLAEEFEIKPASIICELSRQKLYLDKAYHPFKNKVKDNERKKRLKKHISKILARYIVGEYKTVEDESNEIRENKIRQIANDLDRSVDYIIKILKKKKCNNVPIIH